VHNRAGAYAPAANPAMALALAQLAD
jgi:hypothetical protein